MLLVIIEIKIVGVDGIIICGGSSGRTSVAVVVVVIDVDVVVSTVVVVVVVVVVMSQVLYAINLSQGCYALIP